MNAIINAAENAGIRFLDGTFMQRFEDRYRHPRTTPVELGRFLDHDSELKRVHKFITDGQYTDPDAKFHFVTYIRHQSIIWEIDGRRKMPL